MQILTINKTCNIFSEDGRNQWTYVGKLVKKEQSPLYICGFKTGNFFFYISTIPFPLGYLSWGMLTVQIYIVKINQSHNFSEAAHHKFTCRDWWKCCLMYSIHSSFSQPIEIYMAHGGHGLWKYWVGRQTYSTYMKWCIHHAI